MADYDFNEILQEMLDVVPASLSKRVGEPIHTTLAPTAYGLAATNFMIAFLVGLLFADTSEDVWLDRNVYDFGIDREPATKAIRKIKTFDSDSQPFDVPIGTRFAIDEITLKVTARDEAGIFQAECEQTGTIGNLYDGELLPVDNIASQQGKRFGLATLETDPIITARDVETDEALRDRFYLSVREIPFGGNKADYRQKTLAIDGVGAVKVFGAPDMQPGQVGVIIGDELGNKASQELIDRVQTLFGENGDGIAPVWHTAVVTTSVDLPVDVGAAIRLKTGSSFEIVKPVVEQVISDYIENIGFSDETVFQAKLVSDILNSHSSILDVSDVTLNESGGNLSLEKTYTNFEVPTVGIVTVTEVV